jgi:hypothetical protein
MVERVHELNAHIMISVWPKFYPTTRHYKALDERGCMVNENIDDGNVDWVGPGYPNAFYDAFDTECRELYWAQIRDSLNSIGFDAWWLDAVEPDMHANLTFEHRKDLLTPNALGTGAEYFNAYALPHAQTVYEGERSTDGDLRSFILTPCATRRPWACCTLASASAAFGAWPQNGASACAGSPAPMHVPPISTTSRTPCFAIPESRSASHARADIHRRSSARSRHRAGLDYGEQGFDRWDLLWGVLKAFPPG